MDNGNNKRSEPTVPMSVGKSQQHQADTVAEVTQQVLSVRTKTSGFKGKVPGLESIKGGLMSYDTLFVTVFEETRKTWSPLDAESQQQDFLMRESNKFPGLIEEMKEMLSEFEASILYFKSVVNGVVSGHLSLWKRQQRALLDVPDDPKTTKSSNKSQKGKQPDIGPKAKKQQELGNRLDQIDSWFLAFVDILHDKQAFLGSVEEVIGALGGVRKIKIPGHTLPRRLIELKLKLKEIEDILLSECSVVDVQPDQLIKRRTDKKGVLSARIRLLGGLKLHTGGKETGQAFVTVSLISEEEARGSSPAGETNIKISDNTRPLERGKWTADFKGVSFQSFRQERPAGEDTGQLVVEQTYYLEAKLKLSLKGEPVKNVRALSVPIVLTVHQSQEPRARGTIFGKNAFNNTDSVLSEIPKTIPWSDWGQALSNYMEVSTGRGLSPEQIDFLRALYFRHFPDKPGNIEWQKFFKTNIPDKKFSLWEWFYAVVKLIGEHLLPLWQRGLIEGFIAKERVASLLEESNQPGTFILRFAESMTTTKAEISLTWHGGKMGIHHLHPFTHADLEAKPLSDRVLAFTAANYLYPDIPKGNCFQRTVRDAPRAGYVDLDESLTPAFNGQPEPGDNESGSNVASPAPQRGELPGCSNPAPEVLASAQYWSSQNGNSLSAPVSTTSPANSPLVQTYVSDFHNEVSSSPFTFPQTPDMYPGVQSPSSHFFPSFAWEEGQIGGPTSGGTTVPFMSSPGAMQSSEQDSIPMTFDMSSLQLCCSSEDSSWGQPGSDEPGLISGNTPPQSFETPVYSPNPGLLRLPAFSSLCGQTNGGSPPASSADTSTPHHLFMSPPVQNPPSCMDVDNADLFDFDDFLLQHIRRAGDAVSQNAPHSPPNNDLQLGHQYFQLNL